MSTPTRRNTPPSKAIQPAADLPETDLFELGEWYNPDTEQVEPRMVEIRRPDETDAFVLMRINRILDQGRLRGDQTLTLDAIGAFGDAIDSLFVEPADRRYALDAIISRTITIEEYGELMVSVVKRWGVVEEEAPTTGPRATKRAARSRR